MRKATILVIEDVALERKLYSHALESRGYRVVSADSGLSGLRLAQETPPDLMLLDIRMPGLSGFDVVAMIKAHARFRHVPVIALTGSIDDFDEWEILARGFDGLLAKPVAMADLFELADRSLRPETEISLGAA